MVNRLQSDSANPVGSPKGGGGDRTTIPIGASLDARSNVNKEPNSFDDLPPDVQKILADRRKLKSENRTLMDALEGKYVLSLILYLDKMSPVLKSDVYNDISRSSGMATKLEDLENLGIIKIFHTARTISNVIVMTDKGREAAEKIKELIDIVES